MTESSVYAMRFTPHVIQSPSEAHMAPKKILDGLIHSAMMTPFQTRSIDGLIHNELRNVPHGQGIASEGEANVLPATHTEGAPRMTKPIGVKGKKHHEEKKGAKMSSINKDVGMVRFPGSKY